MSRSVETCLSPELLHQHELEGKTVVVIDVLRATTCMISAFMNGADHIVPFKEVEECRKMKDRGYLLAGERGGEKIADFDLGNSPLDYLSRDLKGKGIAITTTNGTQAIHGSEKAKQRIIGGFINKFGVVEKLRKESSNVVLLCSGWKGRINLEDTLLSGALCDLLEEDFQFSDDTSKLAHSLFLRNKYDYLGFLKNASHVERLGKMDEGEDLMYCVSEGLTELVPYVEGEKILI